MSSVHHDPTRWSGRQSLSVGEITLDSGASIDVTVAYETWGVLDEDAGNAVLVEHALTGDSHVVGPAGPDQPTAGWWEGLIGPGAPLDSDRLFIVATNVLGGCRGTTGPSSAAPDGRAWGSRFPHVTIRDQVRVEAAVADALGIERWQAVLGGSMGGMRTAEWVASYPDRVETALVIASTGQASAEQIAWASVQNQIIKADQHYAGGDYYETGAAPNEGMAIARQIAQVTYRCESELADRFGNHRQPGSGAAVHAGDSAPGAAGESPAGAAGDSAASAAGESLYAVESYLQHHGAKLVSRFDAGSFVTLNDAMSSHDIGAGRGGFAAALRDFSGTLFVVSVDSDRLYPPSQSQELADASPRARHIRLSSPHGHDGFLIERDQVGAIITQALRGDGPGLSLAAG